MRSGTSMATDRRAATPIIASPSTLAAPVATTSCRAPEPSVRSSPE